MATASTRNGSKPPSPLVTGADSGIGRAGTIAIHGVRGDDLVSRHDAPRGRADAAKARDGLAAQLAGAFRGDVLNFCHAVRSAVPSAKPSRMTHPEGMKDPTTRGELRAGNLARWGWDRLFAVAHTLGYEVVITLRPRSPVADFPLAAR